MRRVGAALGLIGNKSLLVFDLTLFAFSAIELFWGVLQLSSSQPTATSSVTDPAVCRHKVQYSRDATADRRRWNRPVHCDDLSSSTIICSRGAIVWRRFARALRLRHQPTLCRSRCVTLRRLWQKLLQRVASGFSDLQQGVPRPSSDRW